MRLRMRCSRRERFTCGVGDKLWLGLHVLLCDHYNCYLDQVFVTGSLHVLGHIRHHGILFAVAVPLHRYDEIVIFLFHRVDLRR